jgi:GrpB-like predicted nucleotidyltransferase (UPF0157 family)
MKKSSLAESGFRRNERFGYEEVPRHFESVTTEGLRRIKDYCAQLVAEKYHEKYMPRALQVMLQTIDGEFEPAYATLEADYNARRMNLENAYQEGLADIEAQIMEFEQEISSHNALLDDYAEIHKALTGRTLGEALRYSDKKVGELKKEFGRLVERGEV